MLPFQIPGGWELLIIIGIGVILFGGGKAAASLKTLGKEVYKVKKDVDDIKDDIKSDIINITDITDKK